MVNPHLTSTDWYTGNTANLFSFMKQKNEGFNTNNEKIRK